MPDGVIKIYLEKETPLNIWIYCKLLYISFGAKKVSGMSGCITVIEQQKKGDGNPTFHLED